MNQVNKTDVAIIILNWNAYSDTYDCLKSLENLTYKGFRIFLVDNDSQDDSFLKLKTDYDNNHFSIPITFIQTGANLGFAGGNNVAIKDAYDKGYEYIWLLNNDTEVYPDALNPLVECLEKDQQVGIVGSKIYYYGTNTIWFAGGVADLRSGKTGHIGMNEDDQGQYDLDKEVDYITGCSLVFKRELIDVIGYMEEDYFLYYEETDWNVKARKKNWKVKYIFSSKVYHKVSQSMKSSNDSPAPFFDYYDLRNNYQFLKRNTNSKNASFLICYRLFKKIAKVLIRNYPDKRERFWYIQRALLDSLSGSMGKHPSYKKNK